MKMKKFLKTLKKTMVYALCAALLIGLMPLVLSADYVEVENEPINLIDNEQLTIDNDDEPDGLNNYEQYSIGNEGEPGRLFNCEQCSIVNDNESGGLFSCEQCTIVNDDEPDGLIDDEDDEDYKDYCDKCGEYDCEYDCEYYNPPPPALICICDIPCRWYFDGEYHININQNCLVCVLDYNDCTGGFVGIVALSSVSVSNFAELSAAIAGYAAATSNMTITILNDFTLTSALVIPANANPGSPTLTITGAGRILTRGAGHTGRLFTVNNNARLTLQNITIDGGGAAIGGANQSLVRVNNGGTFAMNAGASLRNNHSSISFNGVHNFGTFNMSGGSISNIIALLPGTSGSGQGVNNFGTFNMSGGTISNNSTGYSGGGVSNSSNSTFTMTSGNINNNTAGSSGGGVHNIGTFTMAGGTISNNTAGSTGGGVVSIGTFTMTGGNINNNTAGSSGGGVSTHATFNMSGGTISDNTATTTGGGVSNSVFGTFTMNSGTISDNTANSDGGGVHSQGTFTMNNGTISNNTTNSNGGGVHSNFNTFTMNSGSISDNTANSNGGGVSIGGGGTFIMNSGVIISNTATNGTGVARVVGTITLNGGLVFGSGAAVPNVVSGVFNQNQAAPNNNVIIAWNSAAAGPSPTYIENTNDDLSTSPTATTAVWSTLHGGSIAYSYSGNTGNIPLANVTVGVAGPATHTVTFNIVNGTWGAAGPTTVTRSVIQGQTLTAAQIPTNMTPSLGFTQNPGAWVSPAPDTATPIMGPMTFTYQYTTPNSYLVTFDIVNGTWGAAGPTTTTATVTHGQTLAGLIPVNMTPTPGFGPGAWDSPAPTAATPITGVMTFTYRYADPNNHIVTFDVADGTWGAAGPTTVTATVAHGQTLTSTQIPTNMTPNLGFSPGAWDSPAPDTTTPIMGPTTFTYRHTVSTYTVTFNIINGTWGAAGPTTVTATVTHDQALTLAQIPTNMTPNPGFTQDPGMWNFPEPDTVTPITEPMIFTFLYMMPNSHIVTFDIENGTWGGLGTTVIDVVTDGDTLSWIPGDMTPNVGFDQTSGAWDAPAPTTSTVVTGPVTFTFRYAASNAHTVTFNIVNGTWGAAGLTTVTATVTHGQTLTPAQIPTAMTPRPGFGLGAWDSPAPDTATPITEPMTFTFRYTANATRNRPSQRTFSVTFVNWDGSVIATRTVRQGGNAVAPENPTREGWTFTGWDRGFTNVRSNITVNALFEMIALADPPTDPTITPPVVPLPDPPIDPPDDESASDDTTDYPTPTPTPTPTPATPDEPEEVPLVQPDDNGAEEPEAIELPDEEPPLAEPQGRGGLPLVALILIILVAGLAGFMLIRTFLKKRREQ